MIDTRLSVLVVDDDRDTADTLTTLLHLTGYRARAAYGGIEGQRMATEDWPDVVILDLLMPGSMASSWHIGCTRFPRPAVRS